MKTLPDLVRELQAAPVSKHRQLVKEFWQANPDVFWRARGRYQQNHMATLLNMPWRSPLSHLERKGELGAAPKWYLPIITLYAKLSGLEPHEEARMRTLFDNPFDIVKYVRLAGPVYRVFHKHADMAAQTRSDEIVEAAGYLIYGSPPGSDLRVFAIPTRLMVLSPPAQPAIDGPALAKQLAMRYDPAGI